MDLSTQFVAEALNIAAPAPKNAIFSSVTSDSRKVSRGCLFVAIPGEKFDGHDFIPQAIAAGAAGIICRRPPQGASGATAFFQVADTVQAYRKLAAAWRSKFHVPVLAVAGSVGKTTTKEFLAAMLRGKHAHVLKTEGSQNGFLGVAMTLLELRPHHGAAVVEIGIDEPGAMVQHLEVVRPTGSLLTAIGPEHLENLKNLETVAREEGLALEITAKANGAVAVNLDDPWIAPWAAKLASDAYSGSAAVAFSLTSTPKSSAPKTPLPTVVARPTRDGSLAVSGAGLPKGATLPCPLPGEHNQRNLLAAFTLAHLTGVTPKEAAKGLAGFQGAGGRTEIRKGGGLHILADHYNANPTSVEAALKLLTQLKSDAKGTKGTRTWACLADMLELGTGEERFHRGLAPALEASGIAGVLLHGPRMAHLLDELRNRRFHGLVEHYESQGALAARLRQLAHRGDWVLVKGSRGMHMEKVLDSLK